MEDFLHLEIPFFRVFYKRWKTYGCRKPAERDNLKEALSQATDGYCMYCYTRVVVDGKNYGHLEHAIEKSNSDNLIECIPNIGLSCSICNQSLKKSGERKRKISEPDRRQFEQDSKCSPERRKQCTVPCMPLRRLQFLYCESDDGKIILQPMGVKGKQTKNFLRICYDVVKMEFLPDVFRHTYSEEELAFIHRHIQRFRLNDPKFRTSQLADFLKNIIDHEGILYHYEYNHLVVKLFAEKLEGKTPEEKVKICSKIYISMFLNLS